MIKSMKSKNLLVLLGAGWTIFLVVIIFRPYYFQTFSIPNFIIETNKQAKKASSKFRVVSLPSLSNQTKLTNYQHLRQNKSNNNNNTTRENKYVFFDLGANNGDTVLMFLDLKIEGINGGRLSSSSILGKNVSWEIHAFEANPALTDVLVEALDVVTGEHKINLYTETAAWTYDGTIDFYLDTINEEKHFWGSSLKADHPDVVKSGSRKREVKCRDIASMIREYSQDDFVLVKMDVEGAEYELILDFIKKDVFKLIDNIAVEFHPDQNPYQNSQDLLIDIVNILGTDLYTWN